MMTSRSSLLLSQQLLQLLGGVDGCQAGEILTDVGGRFAVLHGAVRQQGYSLYGFDITGRGAGKDAVRQVTLVDYLQQGARVRLPGITNDGNLFALRDGKVKCAECVPESLWVLYHDVSHRAQVVIGELAIHFLAGESRQAQQYTHGHAVAGGGRGSHDKLGGADQVLGACALFEK